MSENGARAAGAGPFSHFERLVAWRYLRSRRKEAAVSVISAISFTGIMLGVATLIVVMAVMNGFRTELLTRMLGIEGHMTILPIDMPLNDYEVLADRLAAVPGVRLAVPMVQGQVLSSGPRGTGTGAIVRGLREQDVAKLTMGQNIRQGTLDNFDAGEGVLIGSRMAQRLGIGIGDNITLFSPEGDITPFGVTPRVKAYPIQGIYEIGISDYDASFVFMAMNEAQLFFNVEGLAQQIEVFVDDPDNIAEFYPLIEDAAQRPVSITDWRQRNQVFFSALEVERNVMFMILTMIVLVAALNIISGMIMLVKDKGHDIAILRTMGATSGAIMRIFMMAGASIGVAGTFAGLILGTVLCLNVESIRQFFSWVSGTTIFNPEIYFLSKLPADMESGETISVVLIALALSFLATLFPAWRAARLDPVEALRYE